MKSHEPNGDSGPEQNAENARQDDPRSAIAKAMDIASRLMSVSLCLVIPIIGGYLLDQYLGTVALFLVLGLLFGMAASGWQLFKMVSPGGVLSEEANADQ